MSKQSKTFEVYCISFCGKSYRVKVGFLQEFIDLHRSELENDDITICGIVWDFASKYSHPYEWYRIV